MSALPWLPAALIALATFSAGFLLLARLGSAMSGIVLLATICLGQGCVGLVHGWVGGTGLPSLGWRTWGLLAVVICLLYVGNLAQIRALAAAPNPGWALAVIGGSTAVVCVVAALLGTAPFGALRAVGVALCTLGIVVIALAR